jgi:hypothetical protein
MDIGRVKNKLINSSIQFYFLPYSQLDRPKINTIALPSRPRRITHPYLPLRHRTSVFLVGCCLFFVVSCPQRPQCINFSLLILLPDLPPKTMG